MCGVLGLIVFGARLFFQDPGKVFKSIFQAIGFSEDFSGYLWLILLALLLIAPFIFGIGQKLGSYWFGSSSEWGDGGDDGGGCGGCGGQTAHLDLLKKYSQ
jgi:hypothetical protein